MFRLNNQREKLNESAEQQTNYLWEEYELTPHAAAELRNSEYEDPLALKKLIAAVRMRSGSWEQSTSMPLKNTKKFRNVIRS